ncbi:hypothetical protein AALP_AA3G178900 [Arabis alpina]|uniref:Gag1-like clamp domain-containing protein n=1 Tax=Arabis alpina TaxID=50452 RepID=A0A087H9Y0_ARAAL|nr:hypothetical protein AALP_AA3G178900 [Arabis alpina]
MGGCLACFDHKSKATTNVAVNGSKDVLIEEHSSVASEDSWTNTTLDMESNAGIRSQGSVSSINTSNLTVDSQGCGSGSGSNESNESGNHGLVLWNQTRQQWVGDKRSESRDRFVREPILKENVTYESLLGSNKKFPRPIPLAEMVQFLVDVWEEEGLF